MPPHWFSMFFASRVTAKKKFRAFNVLLVWNSCRLRWNSFVPDLIETLIAELPASYARH